MFKALCGEVRTMSPAGQQVLAPFTFVSSLAGALLAVEFLLHQSGEALTNYFVASPWAPPVASMRMLRSKDPDCEFCFNLNAQRVLREMWPEYFISGQIVISD